MELTNSTKTARLTILEAFASKGLRVLPFSQIDTAFSLVRYSPNIFPGEELLAIADPRRAGAEPTKENCSSGYYL